MQNPEKSIHETDMRPKKSIVVFVVFQSGRAVILGRNSRKFLEHARKIQLIGESAGLSNFLDGKVVFGLGEEQFLS